MIFYWMTKIQLVASAKMSGFAKVNATLLGDKDFLLKRLSSLKNVKVKLKIDGGGRCNC